LIEAREDTYETEVSFPGLTPADVWQHWKDLRIRLRTRPEKKLSAEERAFINISAGKWTPATDRKLVILFGRYSVYGGALENKISPRHLPSTFWWTRFLAWGSWYALDTTKLSKLFPEREMGALKNRVIELFKDTKTKTFSTGLSEHQLKLYEWNEMCHEDRREAEENSRRETERINQQLLLKTRAAENLVENEELRRKNGEERRRKISAERAKERHKVAAASILAGRFKKEGEEQRKCKEAEKRKLKLRQTVKPRAADKTRNLRRTFHEFLSVAPLPEPNLPSEALKGHNKRNCFTLTFGGTSRAAKRPRQLKVASTPSSSTGSPNAFTTKERKQSGTFGAKNPQDTARNGRSARVAVYSAANAVVSFLV